MPSENEIPSLTDTGVKPNDPPQETPAPEGDAPPPSWRDSLPDDLKTDPSLATFMDPAALAKSYVHAQKQIGKNKIVIPDKHASDEDWKGVFQQLGLPKELKDYNLDLPKDAGLDETFLEKFKETAHASGIMPKSAKALLEWYSKSAGEMTRQVQEAAQQKEVENFKALKTEWGESYERNLAAARLAFKDFATDEDIAYLNESGLSKNPRLLKIFSKVGLLTKEEELKGDKFQRGGDTFTPAEARNKANEIMSNPAHPYWQPQHPNHKNAVKEVQDYMVMAHPETEK